MTFQPRFFNLQTILFLVSVLLIDLVLVYLVIFQHAESLYRENSWVENMQVGFLAIGCLLYFVSAMRLNGDHRIVCLFFSMLSFIFMFREVDVDKLDVPRVVIFMLAEQGRAFFFLILLGLLFYELRKFSYYWRNRRYYLSSSIFIFIATAALLLIIFSTAFDQKLIRVEHRIFYEELSEMTAYLMMLGAALFSRKDLNWIAQQIEETASSQ